MIRASWVPATEEGSLRQKNLGKGRAASRPQFSPARTQNWSQFRCPLGVVFEADTRLCDVQASDVNERENDRRIQRLLTVGFPSIILLLLVDGFVFQ